jgi:hypothetical protein
VEAPEFQVDFPTLGFVIGDWIEAHCIIPDGFHKGRPYVMADWQLWCTANHYRVHAGAVWDLERPEVSTNFVYRRSLVVAPQKTGKGPWAAAIICAEAAGPTVFVGWAVAGDMYDCADHGCDCGWVYEYEPGEPMGMPRPTPLIQLTATAKDQTRNVYRPLKAMFRGGWMESTSGRVGEEFIRVGEDGRIDKVTASATARLGNPVTFVLQDESGIYTESNGMREVAETQRRGLAGMDARSIETTNCWDPSEESTAQRTYESTAQDVFRFYRPPPADLSYRNKEHRRKLHAYVYAGSWWVNLKAIEAEAAELAENDLAQASRFFGNKIVRGSGTWMPDGVWENADAVARVVPDGVPVTGGFDGSDSNDWSAIRLVTHDGHRFTPTYGLDRRPTIWDPTQFGGEIPRNEVHAAWEEICSRYKVLRAYCDPRDWQSEIGSWALKYGEKVFVEWATNRVTQMHAALERSLTDLRTGRATHDGCPITTQHIGNARRKAYPGRRYLLEKASPTQKIDAAMSDALAQEAWADALVAGEFTKALRKKASRVVVM